MKAVRHVLFTLLATTAPVLAQPATPPSQLAPPTPTAAHPAGAQVLTLDQAIDIAMHQQPSLRQSRAQLEAARGRIDQVAVNRRPTLTLSASVGASGGGATRNFWDPTANTGLGANASWRLWDFGQTTIQLRAAELSAEASEAGLATNALDIRRDVELAYLDAVARARLVVVADATVKSEEAHLDQAKRFVAAQAKDPIEVSQAQSRAANARASFAQAQSAAATALANLRASIGWVDPTQTLTVPDAWPVPPEQPPASLAELVAQARSKRPEIAQADKEVQAAEANIESARAERRPTLSANASTQWSPSTSETSVPQPSWTVGLTLSWQAFDGGRSAADVRVAKANRESALAQRDALLLDLTSSLDASRAAIEANLAATQASQEAVDSARAQLKLAEARYAQGLGSQIELADAQTAVTTAEGNLIQSQYQLATAWAALHRSLGGI